MTDVSDLNGTNETGNARPDASPAASGTGIASSGHDEASSAAGSARERIKTEASNLKGQAADKARDYVNQGKDRATGALNDASRFLEDTARTVDDKLGAQYGDYARTAAQSVAGFASTLESKDVDALVADARDMVRKSPAIAIGAAATIGFLLARLIKSGTAYEAAGSDAAPSGDKSRGDGAA